MVLVLMLLLRLLLDESLLLVVERLMRMVKWWSRRSLESLERVEVFERVHRFGLRLLPGLEPDTLTEIEPE